MPSGKKVTKLWAWGGAQFHSLAMESVHSFVTSLNIKGLSLKVQMRDMAEGGRRVLAIKY